MIAYTGYSRSGPLVCLAATRDFRTFERRGVVMPPEDKDAALFPCQFDGRWALIHRPVSTTPAVSAHIWLSWSPDLRHWGGHTLLLEAREGAWWDAHKVGLNAPPLATPHGWLILYHGVRVTAAGLLPGLALAVVLATFGQQYFPGVNPVDWLALGGATLVLLLVAVIASYLPARRAARVNPLLALRQD